jgi:putative ATP-dependent endonuclease of OLD family
LSQIFLTTRSTNFIDSGEYSSIYFVTKEAGTTATLLSAEDAADVIPQELGLRLSSLFMFDKLIFVEGPSDEDVLREWSSLLKKNLAGVGFINLGGSRNIKHFAAHKTTEFLGRRGVDLWFVLDRDEKRAAEVTKLQEALGARCKLRTLPVREIENYLVKPESLARYISSRLAKGDGLRRANTHNVTVPEVANAINVCADGLRDFTLGKDLLSRVNTPIYVSPELQANDTRDRIVSAIGDSLTSGASTLNQRAGSLEDIVHELNDEFAHTWSDQKLSRVPGAELLDTVLKRYGLAYRKIPAARGIAASMTADEVPSDIKLLLNEIVP